MKKITISLIMLIVLLSGCSRSTEVFSQSIDETFAQEFEQMLGSDYEFEDVTKAKEKVERKSEKGFKSTTTYQFEETHLNFKDHDGLDQSLYITNRDTFLNTALAYQEEKIKEQIQALGYSVDFWLGSADVSMEVRNHFLMGSFSHTDTLMYHDPFEEAAYQRFFTKIPDLMDLRDQNGESTFKASPFYLSLNVGSFLGEKIDKERFVLQLTKLYPKANMKISFSDKDEETKVTTNTVYYFHDGLQIDFESAEYDAYRMGKGFDFDNYLFQNYPGYEGPLQTSLLTKAMYRRHRYRQ